VFASRGSCGAGVEFGGDRGDLVGGVDERDRKPARARWMRLEPRGRLDLVEKHGLFDPAIGSDGEPPRPEAVAA